MSSPRCVMRVVRGRQTGKVDCPPANAGFNILVATAYSVVGASTPTFFVTIK